ncbi:hypothetical protein B0H14DRAFT_2618671 [Mycena olivaceomarginata]|nr:hypothetical protein B0H14DRAFT_2618671 [Mycena olivaceomarginata]
MTFELHSRFMAHEYLHTAAPDLNADQVGDIVQSIVLHTLQWSSGNLPATQIFMVQWNREHGTGLQLPLAPKDYKGDREGLPSGDFYHQALAAIDREFAQKPNCLVSHFLGGVI